MLFEVICILVNVLFLINFLVINKWIICRIEMMLGLNIIGIYVYLNLIYFENNKFFKIVIFFVFNFLINFYIKILYFYM